MSYDNIVDEEMNASMLGAMRPRLPEAPPVPAPIATIVEPAAPRPAHSSASSRIMGLKMLTDTQLVKVRSLITEFKRLVQDVVWPPRDERHKPDIFGALLPIDVAALALVESELDADAVVAETKGRFSYGPFMILDDTARRMWPYRSRLGAQGHFLPEPTDANGVVIAGRLLGVNGYPYAVLLMLQFFDFLDEELADKTPLSLLSRVRSAAAGHGLPMVPALLRLYWRASSKQGVSAQLPADAILRQFAHARRLIDAALSAGAPGIAALKEW